MPLGRRKDPSPGRRPKGMMNRLRHVGWSVGTVPAEEDLGTGRMENATHRIENSFSENSASGRLARNVNSILHRWTERVRRELPAARQQDTPTLEDSIPEFLETLVQDLRPENVKLGRLSSVKLAQKHGSERSALPEYSLNQALSEYHVLRQIILAELLKEGPLSDPELHVIHDSIDRGVAEAAEAFIQAKLQKELEQRKILESERDLREKFVSVLTHDMRSPLTTAKLSAQAIGRTLEPLSENSTRISRILVSLDRVNQMIQDLLDANQIRAGHRLILQFDRADLVEIMTHTLEDLTSVYGNRFQLNINGSEITMEKGTEKKVELWGFWNRDSLRRVFENLLINAIKYGTSESPVRISIKTGEDQFRLQFQNDGEVLSKEEQGKIFNLFYRSPSVEKAGQIGWGLGLMVVKSLIEAHGGRVSVESEPNSGTIFTVDLPQDSRS